MHSLVQNDFTINLGFIVLPMGGRGGTRVPRGAHTLVIKILKYPISTDFWPKKHPYFNKNTDFFQLKNTPSFIKTLTLDEREHIF